MKNRMRKKRQIIAKWISLTIVLLSTIILIIPTNANATTISSGNENIDTFVNYALQLASEEKTSSQLGLSGEWCGKFVNYCAQHCGLDDIIPNGSSVSNLARADYPMIYGYKFEAESYYFFDDMTSSLSNVPNCHKSDINSFEPMPGDIICLSRLKSSDISDYASRWSHVGIVYAVTDTTVSIVHGNWGSDKKVKTGTFNRKTSKTFWSWKDPDDHDKGKNYSYYVPSGYTRSAFGSYSSPSYSLYNEICDTDTGHIYRLYSGNTTWTKAKDFAESIGLGWRLACMDGDSTQEQGIIEFLVDDFGLACWLGGDNLSGYWKWLSGKSISTTDPRWNTGEPSGTTSSGSTEHYLGMYGSDNQDNYSRLNKWNDFKVNSATPKGFVVEFTPTNILTIPQNTTVIGQEAFYGNKMIDAVIIPNGTKRIEANAFASCTNLRIVFIPGSVEYIAPNAFDGCPDIWQVGY